METLHRYSFPTEIHFGSGASGLAASHLLERGFRRPLVITDRGVAGLPFFNEFAAGLLRSGLAASIFSGVHGNPVESQVTRGTAAYRSHQADCIVGIGGGAALDVAKAVALMAGHPGELFDYEDGKADARPIDQPIPYWLAIPTTAGTGSEVGRSTVISEEATGRKKIIFSPKLLARRVLADPELTLGLPPAITAATGMDALTHCIEAYLAKGYHPICDGVALEGVRLASEALPRAVAQPWNLEARSAMLMASMMGAIAFQKGLGITHSCAHALGTVSDLHHGLANGVMIDFALRKNREPAEARFRTLAEAAGLKVRSADSFLSWLTRTKGLIGIPADLPKAGVSVSAIPALVRIAVQDPCHRSNPAPCEERDFVRVFEEAFQKC